MLLAGNNANGIYPLKYFHGKFDAYQRTYVVTTRDPNRLITKFLYYALRPKLSEFRSISTGAATKFLTLTILNNTAIRVPPLSIQRRIAGILSAYDDLIENNLRRIRILEEMACSVYREWFVHFRFPGNDNVPRVDSPLGLIPEGWEVKRVLDVAHVTYGFPFQSNKFNTDRIGTPVVRIRDILAGATETWTEDNAQAKYYVKDGDILVGMDGDFHMGLWSSGHAYQNQRVAKFTSHGEIGNYHLFLALERPIQYLNRSIVGTTVAHLGDNHIQTIQIVFPPTELLWKARVYLDHFVDQILTLKRQNTNLRCARDLLLPRLLSGTVNLSETDVEKLVEPVAKKGSNTIAISTKESPSSETTVQELPSKQYQAGYELPKPIDQTDRSDALAAIRQVFGDGKPRTREDAIREVARALGYGRTGHRIQDILHTDLLTAVRRGILDNVEDELILLARSIAGYDRDFLKQQFLAAIGRSWVERNDAIQNFCRWMGFRRTGQIIDETARSVINGLLRESRLEANGPNLIRRSS